MHNCEECGENEATELVEVPYGYSHHDGYVLTYDQHLCPICYERIYPSYARGEKEALYDNEELEA